MIASSPVEIQSRWSRSSNWQIVQMLEDMTLLILKEINPLMTQWQHLKRPKKLPTTLPTTTTQQETETEIKIKPSNSLSQVDNHRIFKSVIIIPYFTSN